MQITKLFISGLSLSLLLALAGCENDTVRTTSNTNTQLATKAMNTLEEESLLILSNQTYLTQKEVRADDTFIAPENLQISEISDTHVSLNWIHSDEDNSSIGFFIFYTELEDGTNFDTTKPEFDNSKIINSPDQLDLTLLYLKPNTRYGARVGSFKKTEENNTTSNIEILLGDWNTTTVEFQTKAEKEALIEPEYRLWCENHQSTVILIQNIDTSVDGVRIYRNIKGEARPGLLIEDNITITGEYIDSNNTNGLNPDYTNYEYTLKSYKDINGTREESTGITKSAE